jgi:hypothetical protein
MRILLLLLPLFLWAEISYKGSVTSQTQKFEDETSSSGILKAQLKKEFDESLLFASLKSIYDDSDENRRFAILNELYYTTIFDISELSLGIKVLFWGNLESNNIVDIFNTKDLLAEPFEKEEKLGSYAMQYRYFLDNGTIDFIYKVKEEKRELFGSDSPYNTFGNMEFNEDLKDNGGSAFLNYSSSYEIDEFGGDYTVFFNHGFDHHRAYYYDGISLRERLDRVNRVGVFANLVIKDTILKLENLYTENENDQIGDYNHLGIGAEHTFYKVLGDVDMIFFGEYFKTSFEKKIKGSDIGEIFDNDIFAGARFHFNNPNSTILQLGSVNDLKNDEIITQMEFETRVLEDFTLKLDYKYIKKGDDPMRYISKLGNANIATVAISYNF